MSMRRLVALFGAAVVLLDLPDAAGQVPSRLGEDPGDVVWKLAPEEIPQQVLVSMFFLQVAAWANPFDEAAYERLLTKLGIPPGSDGDKALAQATRSALKVINRPEWPVKSSSVGAAELNEAALLSKANDLADIYGGLLVELASIEGAAERVFAHVENKRLTLSGSRSGHPSPAYLASEEAFALRLNEILDEQLPRKFEQ